MKRQSKNKSKRPIDNKIGRGVVVCSTIMAAVLIKQSTHMGAPIANMKRGNGIN